MELEASQTVSLVVCEGECLGGFVFKVLRVGMGMECLLDTWLKNRVSREVVMIVVVVEVRW